MTPAVPKIYAYVLPKPGYLRITGQDRVDFLQRQSTNDIENLQSDRYVSTVLTNPAARIIDVMQVIHEGDEVIGAITLPGRGGETAYFLKKRIFFMDKVTIEDASEDVALVDVEGEQAADKLTEMGLTIPQTGSASKGILNNASILILGQKGPGGKSFRLVAYGDDAALLKEALSEASVPQINEDQYETLRIVAGIPGASGELNDMFTPLEVGLGDMISETKGCYTGQEVIARQVTYDKITRSLVGLKLDGDADVGDRVLVNDQTVGTITSYTNEENNGHFALAMIKRPHFKPGNPVVVETNGHQVPGITINFSTSTEK